jgi:hypothetical protein
MPQRETLYATALIIHGLAIGLNINIGHYAVAAFGVPMLVLQAYALWRLTIR